MGPLPDPLLQSLQRTAALETAQLFNEGKSSANEAEEWSLARISEVLDGNVCPLCAAVHGMVLEVGSPEYAIWRGPSHINCRRVLEYLRGGEGHEATFREPDRALIEKHGHYLIDPEKHAELRFPAGSEGRNVVVRRVRNLATGEVETRLDWAPWFDQVPEWKRKLVLAARGTTDPAKLEQLLARLGITNLNSPTQLQEVTRLGLADRVEGWITLEETPFERKARTIEQKIAKRAQERGWIITPEGETVYRKVGKRSEITFRPDEQPYFKGNIFIHNHPGGTSFSKADVEIACKSGVVEFRAITRQYRYILTPPAEGWSASFWRAKVVPAVEQAEADVRIQLRHDVGAGIITADEADAVYLHRVWEQVAKETGLGYVREQR